MGIFLDGMIMSNSRDEFAIQAISENIQRNQETNQIKEKVSWIDLVLSLPAPRQNSVTEACFCEIIRAST